MLQTSEPLAERMRPRTLAQYVGQQHLTGENGVLRKILQSGALPSIIFWGSPGIGKTTLAAILAQSLKRPFYSLSAVSAGVKEVREVIEKAKSNLRSHAVLFIDEIHRFNKSQQDALLGAVERGVLTLIGATTENPSFEVNAALLSRCQVYILKPLTEGDLLSLLQRAMQEDEVLKKLEITLESTEVLLQLSGGDARKLLNLFELVVLAATEQPVIVNNETVLAVAQQRTVRYDKQGEQHYDMSSALIKSLRGSAPDAALYWLARMLAAGEDVKFIARRLLIFASEDIGNANPNAFLMATSCFQAVSVIGYPESDIILSQTVIYLACSTKSNTAIASIRKAQELVATYGDLPVPLHLRNAPTQFMKTQGYGKNYLYAHEFEGNFVNQQYAPPEIEPIRIYEPANNARENELRQKLREWWGKKYE